VGFVAGSLALAATLVLAPPEGMPLVAWRVVGVGSLMAVWWITETLPVAATALLPLAAFPLLGVVPIGAAAAPYAHPLVFLFLGGFLLALAVGRWNLHRRVALFIVGRVGPRPRFLIAGFMAATAFLSMWISNTATTILMLPIGLSVIGLIESGPPREEGAPTRSSDNSLGLAVMLSIAYAASIGGLGTLVGTPPNALFAAFAEQNLQTPVGFAEWMVMGLPLATLLLVIAWWVLTHIAFKVSPEPVAGTRQRLEEAIHDLGPMRQEEKRVGAVFLIVAGLWVTRPLLAKLLPGIALTDPGIAIAGALSLFLIPARHGRPGALLDWAATRDLPWGVLILFGGGLSLAVAVADSGLSAWIGDALDGLGALPRILLVLIVVATVGFLTEVTSNTATTATFLPITAALAAGMGTNPLLFAAPVALSASCAFMLPAATPPNAIVFASGRVSVPEMVRAGLLLKLISIPVIALYAWAWGPVVLGAP
jgi:sodium-dependent dicarboxylate transporter 2/3/5